MAEEKDDGHPREGKDAIWTDCSCKRLPCFPGDRAPTGAAVVLCKCKLKFTVTAVLAPASAAFSLQEPRHTHTAIGLEAFGIRCCFSAISLALVFVGSLAAAVSVFLALAWPVELFSNLPVASSIHPSIHCLSLLRSSLPHLSLEHNLNKSAVYHRHQEAFDQSRVYTLASQSTTNLWVLPGGSAGTEGGGVRATCK